jgi:acyl-CoA synthetase (NDP forming)
VGAHTEGPSAAASLAGAQAQRTQSLATALRAAAAWAAEQVGGGVCLVFAAAPGDNSADSAARLRAAAGFPSAQAARDAAQAVLPEVRETLRGTAPRQTDAPPALASRAPARGATRHPADDARADRAHVVASRRAGAVRRAQIRHPR